MAFRRTLTQKVISNLVLNQFGRACNQLGIELIDAHSAQAKGCVQKQTKPIKILVKELRLADISDRTMVTTSYHRCLPWAQRRN